MTTPLTKPLTYFAAVDRHGDIDPATIRAHPEWAEGTLIVRLGYDGIFGRYEPTWPELEQHGWRIAELELTEKQ